MTPHPSIPAWPDKPAKNDNCARLDLMGALSICNDLINYERALAAAWEARLRVAVEALDRMAHGDHPTIAKKALEAIGELPE